MNHSILVFILSFALVALRAELAWTKDLKNSRRAPASQEHVNEQLKHEAAISDLHQKEATVLYQPSHEGKLTLENDERKQVTTFDLETAPSFSEQTGYAAPKTHHDFQNDPQTEIYQNISQQQSSREYRRNLGQIINQKYHEDLKRRGKKSKRNLALELEAQNSNGGGYEK